MNNQRGCEEHFPNSQRGCVECGIAGYSRDKKEPTIKESLTVGPTSKPDSQVRVTDRHREVIREIDRVPLQRDTFQDRPERQSEIIAKHFPDQSAEVNRLTRELHEANERIRPGSKTERSPTVWAYEQVCRANDDSKVEVERLRAEAEVWQSYYQVLGDDQHCLSCGGEKGHHEGCVGTTGLMAVTKANQLLRERVAALEIENQLLKSYQADGISKNHVK